MDNYKKCVNCKKVKRSYSDFRPMRKSCRLCCQKMKQWREENHGKFLDRQLRYRLNHPLLKKLVVLRARGCKVKGLLKILERMYLEHPYCEYCGIALNSNEVSIDHKTSISRGGAPDNPDNWAISCFDCNYLKRDRNYHEFQSFKIAYAKRLLVNTEPSSLKETV